MSCLGPFELNLIKRKIIDKLYLFSPRTLSSEKLRMAVDNPLLEDFDVAIASLIQEDLVGGDVDNYALTNEGEALYSDQGKFKEYFPLADVPRTNFG